LLRVRHQRPEDLDAVAVVQPGVAGHLPAVDADAACREIDLGKIACDAALAQRVGDGAAVRQRHRAQHLPLRRPVRHLDAQAHRAPRTFSARCTKASTKLSAILWNTGPATFSRMRPANWYSRRNSMRQPRSPSGVKRQWPRSARNGPETSAMS